MESEEIIWRINNILNYYLLLSVIMIAFVILGLGIFNLFIPVFEDGFLDDPLNDFFFGIIIISIGVFSINIGFYAFTKNSYPTKIGFSKECLYINYPKEQIKIGWKDIKGFKEAPNVKRWKLPRKIYTVDGKEIDLLDVKDKILKEIKKRYSETKSKSSGKRE